jgi:magnesium-transporting ATPase (P-type)
LGLSSVEAANRLKVYGPNELSEQRSLSRGQVAWSQLKNPLVLILVFAAVVSAMTGGWVDSVIVFSIVVVSAWLGYSREYRAQTTAAELRIRTRAHANVLRDGRRVALAFDPMGLVMAILLTTMLYVVATELVKARFYRTGF